MSDVAVVDPENTAPAGDPDTPVVSETLEAKAARLEREVADTRREAAKYRTTAREHAAAAAELEKIRDSQKSEAEKAAERAARAERERDETKAELIRERIARRYSISDDDLDLLGSGSEEQITARAERLKAKNDAAAAATAKADPPPSDRPTEKLRPGATPREAPAAEDKDAYPSSWRTARTAQTRKD